MNDPLRDDLTLLQQLATQLDEHGEALATALLYADDAARAANAGVRLDQLVQAMGRYQTYGAAAAPTATAPATAERTLAADPALIEAWKANFLQRREQRLPTGAPFDAAVAAGQGWALWKDRLGAFFHSLVVDTGPVGRDELLLAAMDLAPARWFRRRLDQMTVGEWSAAALSVFGLEPGKPPSPFWLLIAGLRALGAGEPLLEGVMQEALKPTPTVLSPGAAQPGSTPDDIAVATTLASGATGRKAAGLLVIARDEGSVTKDWKANALTLDRPILVVRRSDYMGYKGALDWLHQAGAFTGLSDESSDQ